MARGKAKGKRGGGGGGGQNTITVGVRVRPLMGHDQRQQDVVRVIGGNTIVCLDPDKVNEVNDPLRVNRTRERRYAFDHVFGGTSDTVDLHTTMTSKLVDGVLAGNNSTVFAYGQTGSGKTHTMIGTQSDPGLMVHTLNDLFSAAERKVQAEPISVNIVMSFIELYNEVIRDLLAPGACRHGALGLPLREDPIRGPCVTDVSLWPVENAREVMGRLADGDRRRTTESTKANAVSSRSHAVLQVMVETRTLDQEQLDLYGKKLSNGQLTVSKLSLIDLAGSERAQKTQNRGIRLVEGAMINRSLLALGNVIVALGKAGSYCNFRDSKLTRLLKDSLGGKCRTVMITCVSPATSSFEETLNSLKYADRAKQIKTKINMSEVKISQEVNAARAQCGGGYGARANMMTARLDVAFETEIHQLKNDLGAARATNAKRQKQAPSKKQAPKRQQAPKKKQDWDAEDYSDLEPEQEDDELSPAEDESEDEFDESGSNYAAVAPETPPAVAKPALKQKKGKARQPTKTPKTPCQDALKRVAQAREGMLENVRERMELKKAIAELDDQNLKNNIEVSRLQVKMLEQQHEAANGKKQVKFALGKTQSAVDVAKLDKAVAGNMKARKALLKQLKAEETRAEESRAALAEEMRQAEDEDATDFGSTQDRQLLDAEYALGNVKLEMLELEQGKAVHEAVVRERDMDIEKLQLQMKMRNKILRHYQAVLTENGLMAQVNKRLGPLAQLDLGSVEIDVEDGKEDEYDDDEDEEEESDDETEEIDTKFKAFQNTLRDLTGVVKRADIKPKIPSMAEEEDDEDSHQSSIDSNTSSSASGTSSIVSAGRSESESESSLPHVNKGRKISARARPTTPLMDCEDSLLPGWEMTESRSKPGKIYYRHIATGKTSWEKPRKVVPQPPNTPGSSMNQVYDGDAENQNSQNTAAPGATIVKSKLKLLDKNSKRKA
jgi:kinesin family protein 18/19